MPSTPEVTAFSTINNDRLSVCHDNGNKFVTLLLTWIGKLITDVNESGSGSKFSIGVSNSRCQKLQRIIADALQRFLHGYSERREKLNLPVKH